MKNSIVLTLKIMILTVCLVISSGVFSNPMTVYAAENEESTNSQYDISWLGEEGNGAFEKLEQKVPDLYIVSVGKNESLKAIELSQDFIINLEASA